MGLDNLRGIFEPELAKVFHPDVLGYLQDQATLGVAARDEGLRLREECKPHQSAADVLDQCYGGSWKDIHAARVLVVPKR
eukprot:2023784-Lingulodinium_polyedra.AAC.1